eukprot:3555628-Amphidinium_carterae.1
MDTANVAQEPLAPSGSTISWSGNSRRRHSNLNGGWSSSSLGAAAMLASLRRGHICGESSKTQEQVGNPGNLPMDAKSMSDAWGQVASHDDIHKHALTQAKVPLRDLAQTPPTDHSPSNELGRLEPKWLRGGGHPLQNWRDAPMLWVGEANVLF